MRLSAFWYIGLRKGGSGYDLDWGLGFQGLIVQGASSGHPEICDLCIGGYAHLRYAAIGQSGRPCGGTVAAVFPLPCRAGETLSSMHARHAIGDMLDAVAAAVRRSMGVRYILFMVKVAVRGV